MLTGLTICLHDGTREPADVRQFFPEQQEAWDRIASDAIDGDTGHLRLTWGHAEGFRHPLFAADGTLRQPDQIESIIFDWQAE